MSIRNSIQHIIKCSLSNIDLPNNLEYIGDGSFNNGLVYEALTSLKILLYIYP